MIGKRNITEQIAQLNGFTREDLVDRWIRTYGHSPPKGLGRRLLELSAVYGLQANAYGRLKPRLKRALEASILPDRESSTPTRTPSLKPGCRLVRVWNGRTHNVEVVDNGFIWNDRRYRSLTAIAREITGARWSGPRFFGL
jgi:hypothetical protein